jgi:acyl-CoA hydrolase
VSTARKGTVSRITPALDNGAGVVTTRAHVHYVVTEHGAVNLFGMGVKKRAMELTSIAHPDFRGELRAFARERKLFT